MYYMLMLEPQPKQNKHTNNRQADTNHKNNNFQKKKEKHTRCVSICIDWKHEMLKVKFYALLGAMVAAC